MPVRKDESMMRLAVLCSPESWYFKDLCRAADGRYDLAPLPFRRLQSGLDNAGVSVSSGNEDLGAYHAVLVRTMPPGSLEQVVFRMDALAALQAEGTCVVNPPKALEAAVDKYLATLLLRRAGLDVPRTIAAQGANEAMVAFSELGGDVVIKPLFGGEGRGIARLADEALAERAFKMLEQLGGLIYLQEFVPHAGYDLRLFVVGNRVLGMRRSNDRDWRTNVSRGATTEALVVEDRLAEIARRAARAIGAPLAGVDLLPTLDGRLLALEVNAVPGWKALSRTLRIDVAALVLECLREQVVQQSTSNKLCVANP